MAKRKYLPSIADLLDRLSIDQLKEVFISEKKEEYRKEMQNISSDLEELLKGKIITPRLLRAIIVLAQINTHIWYNERDCRSGEKQDIEKLRLTHSINGIRNNAKNVILQELEIDEGKDFKVDCIAADYKQWEINL